MALDIGITVLAGILLAAAVFGTVYPLLPGSPVALVALVVWGWVLGSTPSWTAAGIGAVLVLIGWSASVLLTGRMLKRERIPGRSILLGALGGIIGMFVLPFAGLFLGFAGGLFLSEYLRLSDAGAATKSSVAALKASGLGLLIEFAMVALAGSVWVVGVIFHFIWD